MFQKKMVLPISKQLNPLARHGGYRLGVALNFTQTKIQMPNTKQSSITAFLAPAHCGKSFYTDRNKHLFN